MVKKVIKVAETQPAKDSSYPSYEHRLSRDELFDVLCRRLSALTKQPTKSLKPRFMYAPRGHVDVSVRRVWVFGSAARGAQDCGDIDLLVDVEGQVCIEKIKRAFFNHPRVQLMLGTPSHNPIDLTDADCALVWDNGRSDDAAIGRLRIAAGVASGPARRFVRPTDALVLRPDQFGLSAFDAMTLCDLQDAGLLRADFIPFGSLPSPDSAKLESFLPIGEYGSPSGDVRTILAHLLAYADSLPSSAFEACVGLTRDNGRYAYRRFRFLPGLARADLDCVNEAYGGEMLFMPRPSKRGPNGILHVYRTERHPLVAGLPDDSVVRWNDPRREFYCKYDAPKAFVALDDQLDSPSRENMLFFRMCGEFVQPGKIGLSHVLDASNSVVVLSGGNEYAEHFTSPRSFRRSSLAAMFGESEAHGYAELALQRALEATDARKVHEHAEMAKVFARLDLSGFFDALRV